MSAESEHFVLIIFDCFPRNKLTFSFGANTKNRTRANGFQRKRAKWQEARKLPTGSKEIGAKNLVVALFPSREKTSYRLSERVDEIREKFIECATRRREPKEKNRETLLFFLGNCKSQFFLLFSQK